MGTVVSIQVVGNDREGDQTREFAAAVDRAVSWFRAVEDACNRFDPASDVRRLALQPGGPVPVSPMLFEAVRFALLVAEESGGAFDPTVGLEMERRGFTREYQSGADTVSGLPPSPVSYRDVTLEAGKQTVTIARPLLLDLGAIAKGLAIDMAARELAPFRHYAIDAGGDLYLAGLNPDAQPWSVGIRHPREEDGVLETLRLSDAAVCTSGDYERVSPAAGEGHHLVDARTGRTAGALASATVVAGSAMVADALATAAFVLGPVEGLRLLERSGVEGLLVSPELERFSTRGMPRAALLRNA
jgi:thiamine biosynthesis lipoprotein